MGSKPRERETLSVDFRPIREIGGGSIGQSYDIDALRELGVVDDDGEIKEDIQAKQVITDDGTIRIELPSASD